MKPNQIERLIDAWGADPDRWPPDRRDAALDGIATSPALAAYQKHAAKTDALLDRAAGPMPAPHLAARILAATALEPRPRPRTLLRFDLSVLWPFGEVTRPALAFAAALALGVFVGLGQGQPSEAVDLSQLAFASDTFGDWEGM